MKNIVRHIEYLLQSHDCVIVPGLGAILAYGAEARYDEEVGRWVAPRRVLSFNPLLSRTDGLLAASVARRDKISIDKAAALVADIVADMRRELETTGRLSLGHVGSLEATAHGTLAFETADTAWLSPRHLWLPTVNISRIKTASEVEHEHQIEEEQTVRRDWRAVLRRSAAVAACIALIAGIAWTVKTTLPDAPQQQTASVAPSLLRSHTADAGVAAPVEEAAPLVLVINRHDEAEEITPAQPTSSAPSDKSEMSDQSEMSDKSDKPAPQSRLDESDKYVLVVASLHSLEEAHKYVNQHSDINLGILTVGGRFRVYAATGDTPAATLAAKTGVIARRYPDSWVCRR